MRWRHRAGAAWVAAGGLSARALFLASHAQAHGPATQEGTLASRVGIGRAWELLVALALGPTLAVYTYGMMRLSLRAGHVSRPRAWRWGAFMCGWAVLALAELSPLDGHAEVLLSAHMAQHELLMLVAAPLLVMGRPALVSLWALPEAWRRRGARLARAPSSRAIWYAATAPSVVFGLQAAVLWAWHARPLFDAALAHDGVHLVQHATFLGTAVLFWWSLMEGRHGRRGYGMAVLYVLTTGLHRSLLAALATFADRPWYALHSERTLAAALDPLDDQRLGGLVMWVPFGTVLMLAALALFAAWLGDLERRFGAAATRPRAADTSRRPRPSVAALAELPPAGSTCDR